MALRAATPSRRPPLSRFPPARFTQSPIASFTLLPLPTTAAAVLAAGFFAFLLSLDNVPLSLFLAGSGLNLLPVDLFTAIQFGLTRTVYAVATLVCVGTSLLVVAFYARATSFAVIGRM
jgi:ABC-type spermidine/putrescine transport system permease subunit II